MTNEGTKGPGSEEQPEEGCLQGFAAIFCASFLVVVVFIAFGSRVAMCVPVVLALIALWAKQKGEPLFPYIWTTAGSVLCLTMLFGLLVVVGCEPSAFPVSFSPSKWKANSGRLRMVDDLVDSERLLGLPRDEVHALIGPGRIDEARMGETWKVGSCFPVDSRWLSVTYDASGQVVKVWAWVD